MLDILSTKDDVRSVLATRLKRFRLKAGLSINDVGASLGVSGKTVSAWECMRSEPDAYTMLRLCSLYELESISLFYTDKLPSGVNTEAEAVMLDAYRELTEDGKKALLACARGLKEGGFSAED